MKFRLKQTSKWHDQQEQIVQEHVVGGAYLDEQGKASINIDTLEQLLQFLKDWCSDEIVVGYDKDDLFYIEDYDDYRE